MNDIGYIYTIIIIFVILGFFLPFIHQAVGSEEYSQPLITQLTGTINSDGITAVNAYTILVSIGSMFVWSFGFVPTAIDIIILIPLRLILLTVIARNVWIGGGG